MKNFLIGLGAFIAMTLSVAFPVAATLVSVTVLGSLGVAGGFATLDARRTKTDSQFPIPDSRVLSLTHPSESK